MILSFIEGAILSKTPPAINTGESPLRQAQSSLSSQDIKMTLVQNGPGKNTENETINCRNVDNDAVGRIIEHGIEQNIDAASSADSADDSGKKILEFRNTESEVLHKINVNLETENTETERSMTMNSAEMEAFRRKYDELMKQLETERFERELIARSR